MIRSPELLAPAGSKDSMIAAVQNGADAVYLGVGNFNARRSAENFTEADLKNAVDYCHLRGVKVYVTLNTMVREDETPMLESSVRAIAESGADAILVQDFGVAELVRAIAPDLALHGSTQMAVHNRSGAMFLKKQGFTRVVLAREMDLSAIRQCAGLGIELEVFVHGALCVACSGQCLFSSMVGGRSGNRGRCAQPCRLEYEMDGTRGHLLSTRDLCTLNDLNLLREAGVASFKIEGRLKRPEYVAVVTAAYRNAIDHPGTHFEATPLKQMFNRGGFTPGYFHGVKDTDLIYPDRPNHLGLPIGHASRDGVIQLNHDLHPADVLVLRGKGEDRPVRLSGAKGDQIVCPESRKGDALIRLVSETQMQQARESYSKENKTIPVSGLVSLRVHSPARLEVSGGTAKASVWGPVVEVAKNKAADLNRLKSQILKTGGTPFRFDSLTLEVDDDAFCAASVLNALRREALEQLKQQMLDHPVRTFPLPHRTPAPHSYPDIPEIRIQSADASLLRQASGLYGIQGVFAPEDIRPDALCQALTLLPMRFSLALPMVAGQASLDHLYEWVCSNASRIDCVYLSNIGHFNYDWPVPYAADFSLNLANQAAVDQMFQWGCKSFTPSVELNSAQISPLQGARDLIIHGRLPLMQLRHCPYRTAHHLKGLHIDCCRCDTCTAAEHVNSRSLTDRTGARFPLRRLATSEGCILRLLNSVPLMTLRQIRRLPKADVWRLLIETPEELPVVELYHAAARGVDYRNHSFWKTLEIQSTTTGHYFRGTE